MVGRTIDVGGERFLLVSPRAIIERVSPQHRAVLAAVEQDAEALRSVAAMATTYIGETVSADEALGVLAQMLERGQVVAVDVTAETRTLDAPTIRPLIDPDRPIEPTEPIKPADNEFTAFIELRLVEHDDTPVPAEPIRVRLVDGTEINGHLNHAGSFRLNGIAPGVCRVSFPELDRTDWILKGSEVEADESIDVRVVDDHGGPLAGATATLVAEDGSSASITLDDQGRFTSPGLGSAGTIELQLDVPVPSARPTALAPAFDAQVALFDGAIGLAAIVTGSSQVVQVVRPKFHRVDDETCRFGPSTAMLPPTPFTGGRDPVVAIVAAAEHLVEYADHVLCVVGHAAHNDDDPELRAQQRAEFVVALLRDDREGWVQLATDGGSYLGIKGYLAHVHATLGYPCAPGPVDDDEVTPESEAAVEAFQAAYNADFGKDIYVDGICGTQTLGALFDVLRRELVRVLERFALSPDDLRLHEPSAAVGCGADFFAHERRAPRDSVSGRCVELLCFEPRAHGLVGAEVTGADIYDGPSAFMPLRTTSIDPNASPRVRAQILLVDADGAPMPGTHFFATVGEHPSVRGTADGDGIAEIIMPAACPERVGLAWGADDDDGPFSYARRLFVDCSPSDERAQALARLHNLGFAAASDLDDAVRRFQAAEGVDADPMPRGLTDSGDLPEPTAARLRERFAALVGS